MAMLADLCEYHLNTCTGTVCEIGMNVDMFRRCDEMTERIMYSVNKVKDKLVIPEYVEKVKLFNLTLSMFIKMLLQDCSDRPAEYSDLRFTRYVVDKAATMKQFETELKQFVS